MDYKSLSKDDLIKRIHELEKDRENDRQEKEELIRFEYSMTGNLGPWYWDVERDQLKLHPVQRDMFIPKHSRKTHSFDYYIKRIHEDDREAVQAAFDNHLKGSAPAVNVEYRLLFNDKKYHWLYHRAEVDKRDLFNEPVHIAGVLFDITEKKETEKQLEKQREVLERDATMDFLTKLLNRRGLNKHMNKYLNNTAFTGKLTVAMFDVDNFKSANDTLGHDYGDKVLQEISFFLKENTRSTDIVSRFGGDEFLVIFINTSLEFAFHVCERIRKAIQNRYQSEPVQITLSGGVKEYFEENQKDLIKEVDHLLYNAKKEGKNRIVMR